jgi:hypothetical protein
MLLPAVGGVLAIYFGIGFVARELRVLRYHYTNGSVVTAVAFIKSATYIS